MTPSQIYAWEGLGPDVDLTQYTKARLPSEQKWYALTGRVIAAEAAAKAAKPLEVSSTAQLRDLAASAARVFGWDKGPQTAVQVNEFRIPLTIKPTAASWQDHLLNDLQRHHGMNLPDRITFRLASPV